jgi:isopenicillin-N epimerase
MKPLFLLDPDLVFLNHGSFGACPRPVLEAQQRWRDELERNPVEFLSRRSAGLLAQAREALAEHVGARAADLVFVVNATTGVNVVARSLALREGDEVLTTDHEYGACDATWTRICDARGARLHRVEVPLPFDRDAFVARIDAAVTPRTRLVFASHVSSATALVFPVAELCARMRARGVPVLVDGAHAPGQLPLDLHAIGADFYTGNCHKWLCAPKGSAFLHARPEHHRLLQATVTSWGDLAADDDGASAHDGYTGMTPLERRMQWQGTRDPSPWLAVPRALAFQREHDWDAVRARCHAMAVALMHRVAERTGLAPIGRDGDFAQMVPLEVPAGHAATLQARLHQRHRIEVPVTGHRGRAFVRVSVQGYNDESDLRALERALQREGVTPP